MLGVVHVPVTGQTYYAVAGKGAYLREADGSSRQIRCKEFAIGQAGLEVVGSASHANPTNNTGWLVWARACCSSTGAVSGASAWQLDSGISIRGWMV